VRKKNNKNNDFISTIHLLCFQAFFFTFRLNNMEKHTFKKYMLPAESNQFYLGEENVCVCVTMSYEQKAAVSVL